MSWRSCLEDVGLHVLMSWRAGCLEDVELDVLMSWRSCLEDVGLHVLMSWRATHIKKKFGFQVPEVLVSQTKSDLGTLLETSSFKSTKPLHKTTSREQDILQNSLTNCPVRLYVAIFTHSVVYRPTLKNQSFFLGGLPVLMSWCRLDLDVFMSREDHLPKKKLWFPGADM